MQLEILEVRPLPWPGYVKFGLTVKLTEGTIASGDYLALESDGVVTFARVTSVELFGKSLARWSVSESGAIDALGVGLRLLSAAIEEQWAHELPPSAPIVRACTPAELDDARAAESALNAQREAERLAAIVPWHDEAALRAFADAPTADGLYALLAYLASDDAARARLRRLAAGVTGATLEEDQLVVELELEDEAHTLALHRPARPDAYADWPESFRRLVTRHEYVLFDDGLLLGSGGSFEATFPDGIAWASATVKPRCALTVVPDWYVFEPGDSAPRLWLVSHETGEPTRAVGPDAAAEFLALVR
jgi:hypothetical protein